MRDLYIIAVYTAHCSVCNQNYLIAILNDDKYQQSGLRFILRPNEYLYNNVIDKLESQNIYPCFDDFNEYILSYPFELGKGEIYDVNRLNIDINSLNFSRKIFDNNFIVLSPFEGDTFYKHNPMINNVKNVYSLEMYSLFCKGNYIYSSLQYQKRAIKELISMIQNDFDLMVNNYLNKPYCDLINENISSVLIDCQRGIENKIRIQYPSFRKIIDYSIEEVPDFYYGFAIIQNNFSHKYGIMDIKGNFVVDCKYISIMPLKFVSKSYNLKNYKIFTYIEDLQDEEECFNQLIISVNNNSYDTTIKDKCKKVFRYNDYDLLYFYYPNDEEYDEYKYDSCNVFIYKGLEYVRDYDNIKDINESGKDGYFLITKLDFSSFKKEVVSLVRIDDQGRFKYVISSNCKYYKIQYITNKYWIVWDGEGYDNDYDDKNLEYENEHLSSARDMSGEMIKDSLNARIYHEDMGVLTNYGECQSYTIAEYCSDRVVVLYSGKYYKLNEDEPWLGIEYAYEEDYYCCCYDMNGNCFRIEGNDPMLKTNSWDDYYNSQSYRDFIDSLDEV